MNLDLTYEDAEEMIEHKELITEAVTAVPLGLFSRFLFSFTTYTYCHEIK